MIDQDPIESQRLLEAALAIRQEIADPYSMGADLGNYGIALLRRERHAEALPYLEQARAIFVERGIEEMIPQMDALIAQARGAVASPHEVLTELPAPIRQAIQAQDNAAFQAALDALPEAERADVRSTLEAAGIIRRGPDMAQVLREFDPLLRAIARVALGDTAPRAELEAALVQMEQHGWMLREPVERIWAGEREREVLVQGLDAQDTAIIEQVLGLLAAQA